MRNGPVNRRIPENHEPAKLNIKEIKKIFESMPSPIFVTDPEGNVLLSNSTTAKTLGISLDLLLKSNLNDLVNKGYYNESFAMKAVQTKSVVNGVIKTKLGINLSSISTPVFDVKGNVSLLITNSRPELSATNTTETIWDSQRKREIEYLRSYVLDTQTVIAESKSMKKVLLMAHSVAQTDSTVVLLGESGTGKEVLAKYIHRHSNRKGEAFIAVNCAALPEHLVESELFGYEKGSFTGAKAEGKMGLFEAAHQGTLFLDEIAELPLSLQSRLLRVLESREVRRLGSCVNHFIDFRLIAATHQNLEKMVAENQFRKDLFYRLNVVPIHIPALKDRIEDILPLAIKFLDEFNNKYNREISFHPEKIGAFLKYTWPGNVRELRNVVERIFIKKLYNSSPEGTPTVFPSQIEWMESLSLETTLKEATAQFEEQYIEFILKACGGKVSTAAEKLGLNRTALYRKVEALKNRK